MSKGAPFTADWLGTSPLHLTAQHGRFETSEVLLRAGCSRDARTKVDKTPLHIAAHEGFADICELLLRSGAEVDARDILMMTPLHWAVEKGNILCMEVLLKHGANVEAESKFDKTPADISDDNGRPDLRSILESVESYKPKGILHNTSASLSSKSIPVQNVGQQEEVNTEKKNLSTVTVNLDPIQIALSSAGEISTQDLESDDLINSLPDLEPAEPQLPEQADTIRLLEAHGIRILPEDSPEIKQTLSLTEAGKLVLSSLPSPGSNLDLPTPPASLLQDNHTETILPHDHEEMEEDVDDPGMAEEIIVVKPTISSYLDTATNKIKNSSLSTYVHRSPLNSISISGAGNKITGRGNTVVSLANKVTSNGASSISINKSSNNSITSGATTKTISISALNKPTHNISLPLKFTKSDTSTSKGSNNIQISKVMTLASKDSQSSNSQTSDKPRVIKLSGPQFNLLKSDNRSNIVLAGTNGSTSSTTTPTTGIRTSIPMKRDFTQLSGNKSQDNNSRKVSKVDYLCDLNSKLSLELKEIERIKQMLSEHEDKAEKLRDQIRNFRDDT